MTGNSGETAAWQRLLDLTEDRRRGRIPNLETESSDTGDLEALFEPLIARAAAGGQVLAHLGQSLDGMIATANGASHYVTGPEDLQHKHRLRALFDATVVGAGTVYHDNPRLTARLVAGKHPMRVVIDTNRTLGPDFTLFQDDVAPTLLICARDRADMGAQHGAAEVVGVPRWSEDGDTVDPQAVVGLLQSRGCAAVLLEGGGVTVSRFLRAGVVQRLHLTVAPVLLGAGRAGLSLPEIAHPDDGLRPTTRHFTLGGDMLFDCNLDD